MSVTHENEVMLGGCRFKVAGGVRATLASNYPGKVVSGDITKDSQPRASVLALSDFRAGIGQHKSEEAATVDRVWWSTCNLRHRNAVVLSRLANATAAGPASTIEILVEFNNEMYAAFGTSVRKYNNSTDSWGSELHSLPGIATDSIVVRLQGTVYLFIAHTDGYSYTSDGSSWTDDTEDIKYLAYWDSKIWGIDNTGQLRYSTWLVAGEWVDDAPLPLPDGFVTDLFVGEDAANNSILYAMTKVGLWAHDFANEQWVQTKLTLPLHPNNGEGTIRWRDGIYIPAGNGVYKYQDGTGTAVVSVMGPDRDDGLPSDKRGVIRQMLSTHNELLAVLDSTTAPAAGAIDMFATQESPVIEPDIGFSSILGWDERGWQVLWLGGDEDQAISYAAVANAYDEYRLWWGQNQRVFWMKLPQDITNPEQISDQEYAPTGVLETPWFNLGEDDVNKLGLHFEIGVDDITATETITLSYALDFSETYTQLATIDEQPSNGIRHYHLPSAANHRGFGFKWIRFKVDFTRGSTTTLSPILRSLVLIFRKKLPLRFGFTFNLDLSGEYDNLSPRQQRFELKGMAEQNELVEFMYRPFDANDDEVRRHYVDVVTLENIEDTGLEERGISRVALVEV